MPSRNTIKQYVEGGYYHVYNRGVEKRDIFLDDQDYRVFLNFLKTYLSPQEQFPHPLTNVTGLHLVRPRILKNFFSSVELLAYCLMPNHFHLLLKQNSKEGMPKLLQALGTSYSMYFNKKYQRVGALFQGTYKAVLIDHDSYLLHLSRYLHLNPLELTGLHPVKQYPYSSYVYYLGEKNANWINPQPILNFFKTQQRLSLRDFFSYQSFIEDYQEDTKEVIGRLAIE